MVPSHLAALHGVSQPHLLRELGSQLSPDFQNTPVWPRGMPVRTAFRGSTLQQRKLWLCLASPLPCHAVSSHQMVSNETQSQYEVFLDASMCSLSHTTLACCENAILHKQALNRLVRAIVHGLRCRGLSQWASTAETMQRSVAGLHVSWISSNKTAKNTRVPVNLSPMNCRPWSRCLLLLVVIVLFWAACVWLTPSPSSSHRTTGH
jgi:hypothetical protein